MTQVETPSRIVVQKYGGSSLADVPRVRAVAERVVATVREGWSVVVVVSAMGNTTNELLALARQVSPSPKRRELDLLVSVGERVSMTLLAMAIEDLGVPAASFTGSQSGIMTDEQHVSASVVEVRPHRIQRALSQGKVAIVAGFQGVSRHGEVTTLGRGGSDTTAVVLTAALGAAWCEICSDVDGVYTADPRVVHGARRLDELTLDAGLALARAGSTVLLADALEHARRVGITLSAVATNQPSGSGTRLPPGPAPREVVGVTSDGALRELWLPDVGPLPSLPAAVRGILPVEGGVRVLVDERNLHGALDLPAGAVDRGPVASVSAVGRDLVANPVQAARAFAVVRAVAPLRAWWATGETWTALVERAASPAAQRALHEAFLELCT